MSDLSFSEEAEPAPAEEIAFQLEVLNELKAELENTPTTEPGRQEALVRVKELEERLQKAFEHAKASEEALLQFATLVANHLDTIDPIEQKRRAVELQQSLNRSSLKKRVRSVSA